jgi:hypothetical protein
VSVDGDTCDHPLAVKFGSGRPDRFSEMVGIVELGASDASNPTAEMDGYSESGAGRLSVSGSRRTS